MSYNGYRRNFHTNTVGSTSVGVTSPTPRTSRSSNRVVHRGHIYYAYKTDRDTGAEIHSGRPCVIVSDEKICETSGAVMAVYLTSAPKENLDTHVYLSNNEINSTALCEQIVTISKCRLGDHIGKVSDYEMECIEKAMIKGLGLNIENRDTSKELIELRVERDTFKKMYDSLVNRMTKK